VNSLDAELDCAIELIGDVRIDALLGRRYLAYSAEGADCDAAAEALGRHTAAIDIQFLRRPSLAQVRMLVSGMIRSVEMTTGCRITLRGAPSLVEETSRWLVTYVTSGRDCSGVQYVLRDQGDDLDISFVGGPARGSRGGIP